MIQLQKYCLTECAANGFSGSKKLEAFSRSEIIRRFKNSVENATAVFNRRIFASQKFSLINCRFSLRCEAAFSPMKKLETFFIGENIRRFKMNFRKATFIFALAAALAMPIAAQEKKGGHRQSEISYYSTPIYKILDSHNAYVVIYGKPHNKMGTVTIPKEWARNRPGEVKKLVVRKLPPNTTPYITIVKKSGDFLKVLLTVPTNHSDPLWGIANENKVDDVSGAESIELEI